MGAGVSRTCGGRAEGKIFRLTYQSQLTASSDVEAEHVIAHVISSALKNNPRHDISGMLFFDVATRSIIQVLEGPRPAIMSLYSLICVDKRHTGCRILDAQTYTSRSYAGMGMALTRVEDQAMLLQIKKAVKSSAAHEPQCLVTPEPVRKMLNLRKDHLIRVQYSSLLLATNSAEAQKLISKILECAVAHNHRMCIGGLLCFHPKTLRVTQILEGPAAAVLDLFDKITIDPRHRDVVLTSQEVVLSEEDVQFDARWGMMQIDTAEPQLLDLAPRLRAAYTAYDSPDASKAVRQRRIETALGHSSFPIDSTPAQDEFINGGV